MSGRYGLEVHGYVLMPNHYHLIARSPKANTREAMQWLNNGYGGRPAEAGDGGAGLDTATLGRGAGGRGFRGRPAKGHVHRARNHGAALIARRGPLAGRGSCGGASQGGTREGFRDRYGDGGGRDLALWVARRHCGMTLRALGEAVGGMDYSVVSEAVRHFQRCWLPRAEVRSALREVLRYLNLET